MSDSINHNNPSASRPLAVAVVGATGAVGVEIRQCLEQSGLNLSDVRLLASPRSAGQKVPFAGGELTVQALGEDSFAGIDYALFSAGSGISKQFAPLAVAAGAVVIDNSSAFRMDADIPLVVPEVNPQAIPDQPGIIANPNCVAIIATVPLAALNARHRIRRLNIATYQAASGAGAAAMEELRASTAAYLAGEAYAPRVLKHPYAFNLFSHDAAINPDTGYNGEEEKVVEETRKILSRPDLHISITCVRVPVLRAHSMAVTVEFDEVVTPETVKALLADAPGVRLVDDWGANHFPMPNEASGQGDVLVGRIRRDAGDPSGRSIALFLAGDQLLKGAALNAVQILQRLAR
ncbi:aspartate-semialdehyde dehydrogenase [Niveispirillum irakense]|uniref:aspartate-semialdehyde dehydrogenase n=1 Tax=Niveispirillum irakense TaxID=34011 RepID=UPI000404982A|nr:aspartate-semialdehyde dehydrogenase [Niveispirillum irakense]